jgi:hypothetical protein
VYEFGNPVTKYQSIKSFTKQTNLFDLDYFEGDAKRKFEYNCSKIETHYPKLITSIESEGRLNDEGTDLLTHYLPSLLCRSVPFRTWVEQLISHKETRLKFFKEITMFMENGEEKDLLMALNSELDTKFQVNFVMFYVMQFFLEVMSSLNFVLLKDYGNRGWFTTDNPVVHDKKGNHEWTIPPESEFYLPLNPTYCLFVYNSNVESENNLRNLEHQSTHVTNADTHQIVNDIIVKNAIKYIISPVNLGKMDLRTGAT